MPELLLEIGFEEMPAPWLAGLGEQARALFERLAAEQHLEPSAVQAFFTPRRLVVAAQVAARQADREERVWGPSLKVAKDAGGAWTNAANGFAKKVGSTADALEALPKDPAVPDDVYLSFVKRTPGRASSDVLPAVVAAVLRGLAFPKRMSWDAWLDDGKGAFPFGRPIRWLVALLDGAIVPFTIFELVAGGKGPAVVESGKLTHGHRFLPRGSEQRSTAVGSLQELGEGLRKLFVLLDPVERERRVAEQLAKHNRGQAVADDHGLAAEWRDLVEYPTVLAGSVPAEFRALPTEVLETVLVHHQKYVPLLANGQVEGFAAVTNGDGGNADAVVRNMERVVVARLRDAAFFFAEDRKRRLEDRVSDLSGVTFHRDLGTYLQKTERLIALVDFMKEQQLLDRERHAQARTAAQFSKADLTTLMVREFPELQGTMGGIYFSEEGGEREVSDAIRWHYHPIAIEESAEPRLAYDGRDASVFLAVSLADKLDTLAGYFLLGENPTGSRDPFGLRRAAQGVIRLALDFWKPSSKGSKLDLDCLLARAVSLHSDVQKSISKKVAEGALAGFLVERLVYVLQARGYPADEVAAVTNHVSNGPPDALSNPIDCLNRLRALHTVRTQWPQDFAALAAAFKRAGNLLRQAEPGTWSLGVLPTEEHFPEGPERELLFALHRTRSYQPDAVTTSREWYEERFRNLATIRKPVDEFFDKVMVLTDSVDDRNRRLGLVQHTVAPILRLADISLLGG